VCDSQWPKSVGGPKKNYLGGVYIYSKEKVTGGLYILDHIRRPKSKSLSWPSSYKQKKKKHHLCIGKTRISKKKERKTSFCAIGKPYEKRNLERKTKRSKHRKLQGNH